MKINLNIGGTDFVTTRETLLNKSGFFAALVRNTDADAVFFVDRDPTYFMYILNYLRGSEFIPSKP